VLCGLVRGALRGFVQPSLGGAVAILDFLWTLLERCDSDYLHGTLEARLLQIGPRDRPAAADGAESDADAPTMPPPLFALSWCLTWMAHCTNDLKAATRLLDLCLGAPGPLMIAYMAAALVLQQRQAPAAAWEEPGEAFRWLQRLPELVLGGDAKAAAEAEAAAHGPSLHVRSRRRHKSRHKHAVSSRMSGDGGEGTREDPDDGAEAGIQALARTLARDARLAPASAVDSLVRAALLLYAAFPPAEHMASLVREQRSRGRRILRTLAAEWAEGTADTRRFFAQLLACDPPAPPRSLSAAAAASQWLASWLPSSGVSRGRRLEIARLRHDPRFLRLLLTTEVTDALPAVVRAAAEAATTATVAKPTGSERRRGRRNSLDRSGDPLASLRWRDQPAAPDHAEEADPEAGDPLARHFLEHVVTLYRVHCFHIATNIEGDGAHTSSLVTHRPSLGRTPGQSKRGPVAPGRPFLLLANVWNAVFLATDGDVPQTNIIGDADSTKVGQRPRWFPFLAASAAVLSYALVLYSDTLMLLAESGGMGSRSTSLGTCGVGGPLADMGVSGAGTGGMETCTTALDL
jgi:hypothetical protein